MNEKIESLAFEKDFAALSQMERAMVLAEMPQEEFEQLRRILLAARGMDTAAMPPARLRAQLLDKMAAQPKPDLLRRAFATRIPLWLAMVVLLLATALVWRVKKETVQEKIVTKIQVQTDTIWQDKILWREKVVWRDRVIFKEKPNASPVAIEPQALDSQNIRLEFLQPEFTAPHIGTSLGDTPELMGFFTQGDK